MQGVGCSRADAYERVSAGDWAALRPGDHVGPYLAALARAAAATPPAEQACALLATTTCTAYSMAFVDTYLAHAGCCWHATSILLLFHTKQ